MSLLSVAAAVVLGLPSALGPPMVKSLIFVEISCHLRHKALKRFCSVFTRNVKACMREPSVTLIFVFVAASVTIKTSSDSGAKTALSALTDAERRFWLLSDALFRAVLRQSMVEASSVGRRVVVSLM